MRTPYDSEISTHAQGDRHPGLYRSALSAPWAICWVDRFPRDHLSYTVIDEVPFFERATLSHPSSFPASSHCDEDRRGQANTISGANKRRWTTVSTLRRISCHHEEYLRLVSTSSSRIPSGMPLTNTQHMRPSARCASKRPEHALRLTQSSTCASPPALVCTEVPKKKPVEQQNSTTTANRQQQRKSPTQTYPPMHHAPGCRYSIFSRFS